MSTITTDTIIMQDDRSSRRKTRIIDLDALARSAREAATTEPVILMTDGGGVARAYGYPAETDIGVAIAFPGGPVLVWATRDRVSGPCVGNRVSRFFQVGRDYDDRRVGAVRREAARKALLAYVAHLVGAPHDEATCVEHAMHSNG